MKTAVVQAQQRWEHTYVNRKSETSLVESMNELGQQGWELVTAAYYKDAKGLMCWTALLKRPTAAGQSKNPTDVQGAADDHTSRKFDPNGEVFDVQK
jgi:hypothetical protein